ncbi:hypothetical protein [Flavobacterium sp.]|uniref:hypothetical protein n=1 Tax=Flavobacterium sp. TaxID=239 RepID=UPI0026023A76|nr:hypothetical protein [Flavobacterium sp.]
MKLIMPKRKINQPITPKNSNFKKTSFSILVSITLLFSLSNYGQEITELKKYISQSKLSVNPSTVAESKHLNDLISDLNSSVIIKKGNLNTYSNAPFIRAVIDSYSINKIPSSTTYFNNVELLIIRIEKPEDLSISIDESIINQFPKLKYVYFLCTYNCTFSKIENLVKYKNTTIKFLYSISIPS